MEKNVHFSFSEHESADIWWATYHTDQAGIRLCLFHSHLYNGT